MSTTFGLMHMWSQGDIVTRAIALVLLCMSMISWVIIVGKLSTHLRYTYKIDRFLIQFWSSENNVEACGLLKQADSLGAFSSMADQALRANNSFEQRTAKGIGAQTDRGEFIARTLQHGIMMAQTRIESGLTVLASVGATAPFIGLLGTVWGIYHALVGLSGLKQVGLDQVAGPVGEALVMTAAGLFVAIPAVLAYNTCTRANRLIIARLDGFAHGLHNYLVGGVHGSEMSMKDEVQTLNGRQ
jgi:biopolymer transport protein ExbB